MTEATAVLRPVLTVVVPALNEHESLARLIPALNRELEAFGHYEIIVVDDGSTDDTPRLLRAFHERNSAVQLVRLSRNFGHQAALRAGLRYATGRAVISMDADFQHPVELIPQLVKEWRNGFEIVTTRRCYRSEDRLFKRIHPVGAAGTALSEARRRHVRRRGQPGSRGAGSTAAARRGR